MPGVRVQPDLEGEMPDVQGFQTRPQLVTGARVVPGVQVQPDVQVVQPDVHASGSGVQGAATPSQGASTDVLASFAATTDARCTRF